jgi:trk system potassium uptake protein TrkH
MNYRIVAKYLGHFVIAVGLLMLPSVICAICFAEWQAAGDFSAAMVTALIIGGIFMLLGRKAPQQMFQREGLALVGLGWILTAAVGALPYLYAGVLGPVDAYFESMSGFTTTGSTVIRDIEALGNSGFKSILFWRSFTHWLGGMGIIVLFIAVLPYLGVGGKQLFKSESPGPDPRGLSPRIKDTASTLWKIYVGLTIVQTVLLMIAGHDDGMDLYNALCHTFATLATGGFSTQNASIAAFNSASIEWILIVFMILAGTNFGLYFTMYRGNWTAPFKNTEWCVFLAILGVATLFITMNLLGFQGVSGAGAAAPELPDYSTTQAIRHAAFTVVSITTTTGFCTENFDTWPYFSRTVLVVLMFVGGCAGSTGGGLKVVRVIMLIKMAYWRLERSFRPKTVRPIRINGVVVDDDVQRTVYGFFVLYVMIFVVGSMFMSLLGLPFQSAITSVAATLNNIGPGLEQIGAIENFHFIPASGKIFLSLCMVMGRLELFSICVLFIPSFWKHS